MSYQKPHYKQKPRPPVYFNFDFDPEKITIKTQIPALPEKKKVKPDEKSHNKKIKELEDQVKVFK